ncbi:phosphoribulokinase/uridine kinase family protein [Stackebrandtia albiflava]|uniref:Phosphoribulokinase/uridine kinase family protein n=1 Tax=Stackebrandtia albiflava TaxID=406432 RepID=A0A562VD04_9ACTN|nr:nucleoside/nucleotide kinase family protein [Stackebrandtia albiflava]TWJ15764.1 phosphoribulokinase/uridine kinase family protein [Stackebrandtia albiflava]
MDEALLTDAIALTPAHGRAILAVAGPPGAGKSTLAVRLVDAVNARLGDAVAAYVPLDGFHLSNRQLDRAGTADRKGARFTFDVWGYLALLRRLLSDTTHPVYVPDYDRRLHEPIAARHVVEPRVRLVVTEGNYLASTEQGWREVADLAAELWYVETPRPLREARLLRRQRDGGRDAAAARAWVDSNDLVNAEEVEAQASRCDRVVTIVPGDA